MSLRSATRLETLELSSLMQRICVRPPYFALRDLAMQDSAMTATATAEIPVELEVGPMSAAELGRHAAIAGLCRAALSQDDDRRRYYLAQRAECSFESVDAPFGSEVAFRAELLQLDKRQARASITATHLGRPLAVFDISYTILTEPAFGRLFGTRRQPTDFNLSSFAPKLEGEEASGPDWATFRVPCVPVSACAGHFDDFPVLPVAVLMGKLSELAGKTLSQGKTGYRVRRGSISAKDLCWASESADFRVELADRCGSEVRFHCVAQADERKVGTMELMLEAV